MANFFIRRPIVAMVISILIVLVGTAALLQLPVEQYPQLAPPNIQVTANYPGASAEVVEQSVATPIEQQSQRRGQHALHEIAQFERRSAVAQRHVPGRHGS
jgi:multidrug efflux pump subunit AcrB